MVSLTTSSAIDAGHWYPDADSDGYGQTGAVFRACIQPESFVSLGGDCDDANPLYIPTHRNSAVAMMTTVMALSMPRIPI